MVNSKDYKDKNEYKKALRSSFSDTGKKPPVREVSKKKKLIKRSITIPLTIFLITGTILLILWGYAIRRSQVTMKNVKEEVELERLRDEKRAELEDEERKKEEAEKKANEKVMLPEIAALYKENPDIAGYLTIDGSVIDYPVMFKENDNDYYLEHGFDGSNDVNGCLVLDKRCDKEGDNINTLIHGHNLKSGKMFGSLSRYESKDYCLTHPYITYSSKYKTLDYQVFAVFISLVYNEDSEYFENYDYINIENKRQFDEYVKGAVENSLYETGVRVDWGDKLLTLSTCEYSKENGRLVVVARAIDHE